MMQLPQLALAQSSAAVLRTCQAEIDDVVDYAERVALAKRRFENKHSSAAKKRAFDDVRRVLGQMCHGTRRCVYCEDSVADEIEHMRPKDLYPEQVFVWQNYVYACGPCNGPKNNKFAVINGRGALIVVTRARRAAISPPVAGAYALLDPRVEDPLSWLLLDTVDTFEFACWSDDEDSVDYLRADYTREVLCLNRDPLPAARRNAFALYLGQLTRYQGRRDAGASAGELAQIVTEFLQTPHPTVWAEMKRQRSLHGELDALLQRAPEALTW